MGEVSEPLAVKITIRRGILLISKGFIIIMYISKGFIMKGSILDRVIHFDDNPLDLALGGSPPVAVVGPGEADGIVDSLRDILRRGDYRVRGSRPHSLVCLLTFYVINCIYMDY
jgi:hypothetical protein